MHAFTSPTAHCQIRWMDLPGNGIPLVMIHGLGCAASYEYPPLARLSPLQGRRMILVDLPGYGYSDKPDDFPYTTTAQAQVVTELLTHLHPGRVVLYGHSMGGSISIEVATTLGERLAGLVVSEPNFYPGGGFFSKRIAAFSEQQYITTVHRRMIRDEHSPWAGCMAAASPRAVWRSAQGLVNSQVDWLAHYCRLTVPTRLLFGEHSLPDAGFDTLQRRGNAVQVLPGCGHSMSWEAPAALAQALGEFCQQVERPVT